MKTKIGRIRMRVKSIELKNFKRFTHLTVEGIPETAKLVVLVGSNGSGKTSFMESMNHFYNYLGFYNLGDYHYLSKEGHSKTREFPAWHRLTAEVVSIHFHDVEFTKQVGQEKIKGRFYFRTAYRNEPEFKIESMQKLPDPTQSIRLPTLIQNDQAVSSNYQRLIADTISEIYDKANDTKSVASLRNELVGRIQDALHRVFDDLQFTALGNPLTNGNFYFTKGSTENFSYQNLSAGEKAAFDLILDIVAQSKYFSNAVYCIDEPELHMHTKLQGKVLRELYELIPGQSQLWVSTHSIGMLQEAEDIEKEKPGTVVFLDFGNRDFDTDQIIRPSRISKAVRDKFYELAFGDFAKLVLPKKIVICEGCSSGTTRKDFDRSIYSTIFSNTHPDVFFVSGGSCNDIENVEKTNGGIIQTLLRSVQIIKVIDRDERSDKEVSELIVNGIRVLKKRNLESYLLDDSVIKKLCEKIGKPEEYNECIKEKMDILNESIVRGKPSNDYKSVRGEIYTVLKKRLNLTQCGNSADTFIRDTLAPLITPDMDIYKELDDAIFGGFLNSQSDFII